MGAKRLVIPLLLPVLLFIAVACHAQPFPLVHYSMKDGLPSNRIYQVYCDSKGFIWLGTDKGAVRYNGLQFERFTTFDGLPDNEVFSFKEDNEHRLWIGTYSGDLCYYKDNIFYTANNASFLKMPILLPYIERMVMTEDSSVLFIFRNRLQFVKIHHREATLFKLDKVRDSIGVENIILVKSIAGSRYELLYTDKRVTIDDTGRITSIKPYKYNKTYTYSFSEDQEYLLGKNGIYTIDEQLIAPLGKLRPVDGYTVVGTGNGCFFLGTPNGLLVNDSLHLLKGVQVTGICRDLKGNYWISTVNNGVFCLNHNFLQTFEYLDNYKGHVKWLQKSGASVLFLTNKNHLYTLRNRKVAYIRTMTNGSDEWEYKNLQQRIAIRLANSGLTNSGKIATILKKGLPLSWSGKMFDFFFDERYIYGISHDEIKYTDYHGLQTGASNSFFEKDDIKRRIFCWAEDADGDLWFSTADAVYKVSQGKIVPQPLFQHGSFRAFTFHNGYLIGYTHKNNLLVARQTKNGLLIDTIKSQNCIWDKIYPIDKKRLLITTEDRYRLLDLKEESYTLNTIENEFLPKHAEYVYSDTQSCYFFKDGVVCRFKIEPIFKHPKAPLVFFSSLKTEDTTYDAQSGIILSYKRAKNIRIAFNALSFDSKSISYQYAITAGGEDSWHDIEGEVINLAEPGYGHYIIKVKAKSTSSDYSVPAVLHLEIKRPLWAAWWFLLLSIFIIVLIVRRTVQMILRRKLNKRQKEYELEMKYQRSEFKALNALMNPHFIFNSLANIQGLINGNKKAAEDYLMIFSKLVRQNMHNVSKEFISLQKELDLIKHYLKLEQLRFKNYLNYRIEISDTTELDEIFIPPLLIQPLVENAIRHGLLPLQSEDAMVIVRIYEKGDLLYIEVEDNGVGISQSSVAENSLHQSMGLTNLQQRVAHMCRIHKAVITFSIEELKDEQGRVSGTLAVIKIDLSNRSEIT